MEDNIIEPWIETFTGKRFWFFEPSVDDIDLIDIAHALSNTCRYGGHSSHFYSVAEHSVLTARFLDTNLRQPPRVCLTMLLHDASEAYVGDMPRPIKRMFDDFKSMEDKIQEVISLKFGLYYPLPDTLKEIDNRILLDEKAFLMNPHIKWGEEYDAIDPLGLETLPCWDPIIAKKNFLREFERYASMMSVK